MVTSEHPSARSRPTIRDVAAAAGVSVKTVSRVVNHERDVAPATEARVQEAIARLGFRRDEAAANLRRLDRSTRVVGLITEDLANPFYSQLAKAVEGVARSHGYLLTVASSDEDATTEREVLSALCERRVDGLIVVPTGTDHSFLTAELAGGLAAVFVDRPALEGRVDSVLAANAQGATTATEHLLAGGHRRIAFIGDNPEIFTAAERHRGYAEAMMAAGAGIDSDLVRQGPHDVAAGAAAFRSLMALPDPPTAVFAGNNRITLGVMRALAEQERSVAVVGFDDFELADMLRPAVTVVAQDIDAMGRTAAELLFRRLGGDRRPAQTVLLGTRLIPRGSGEVPPASRGLR
ncbi:LacI family transcriptional regulator [Acidiferrimicrobium sp. IK]|uniref:LacI family DNA-binding transcriptional regulator n=1 Tax=Acidiferrimicrobium sp. IK TaxID=2871700 RepID=UPI0021CB79A2|nr:LacI family DNA-binding transcriptional regulator [Acidiferrimicrobium sp. IK]MCU4186717.1 LacI family transcriptional regulator [Acidiferrimicrobium sp. IK]